jgi:ATP/ADP translocase
MKSLITSLTSFATLFIASAGVALAKSPFPEPTEKLSDSFDGGPKDVITFIDVMTNWFFALLLTIAVIFILLAAYHYMTGSGGEGVTKAHKMLLYAAVGIAVAVLAKGIVFAVRKLVDSDTTLKPASELIINAHSA